MLIYGTRMYGKKNRIRSYGRCPHCGKLGNQESYDGRKWGHLYFIPLIPEGGKVRVLRECASCNTGSHIPLEDLPGIVAGIKKTVDHVVIAVGAKESEMTLDGESLPVAAVLSSHISDVYCLVGERETAQLLANLQAVQADEELLLAEAKIAETKGELKKAGAKFAELAGRTSHPTMLFQAARFFFDQKRIPEATALAERVETMWVADLGVKQLLLDCYTAANEWSKLAHTYESCFLLSPELTKEKPVMKAYKKACKKAGREPQVWA